MAEPIPKIGVVSNIFVRQMTFAHAGDIEQGHKHQFDHLSLLASGSIRVRIGADVSEFAAPHMVLIRANQEHEVTALQDNTVMYCIHGLRANDGTDDLIDPAMVPKGPALAAAIKGVLNVG
jgi:quercetin dioxygenase-like cupin family protein